MPINTIPIRIKGNLIVAEVVLDGSRHSPGTILTFAIDTGCSKTIIKPQVLMDLGYSKIDKTKKVSVTSASEREKAHQFEIKGIKFLGFSWKQPTLIVKDLHSDFFFIDGLLGLDFFQEIKKTLSFDFDKNTISLG